MIFLQIVAFAVYGFFWLISSLVYLACDFCQWADVELAGILDALLEDDNDDSGGGGVCA